MPDFYADFREDMDHGICSYVWKHSVFYKDVEITKFEILKLELLTIFFISESKVLIFWQFSKLKNLNPVSCKSNQPFFYCISFRNMLSFHRQPADSQNLLRSGTQSRHGMGRSIDDRSLKLYHERLLSSESESVFSHVYFLIQPKNIIFSPRPVRKLELRKCLIRCF